MAELEWQDALIYHAQKNKQYVDDEIKKVNASGGGTEVTKRVDIPYTINSSGHFVKYTDGGVTVSANYSCTDFVDISEYKEIKYARYKVESTTATGGMAFYDSTKTYISGVSHVLGASGTGYEEYTVAVPANAKYARFTRSNAYAEDMFYVYAEVKSTDGGGSGNTQLESELRYIKADNYAFDNIKYADGIYITRYPGQNGNYATDAAACATDYIEVVDNTVMRFRHVYLASYRTIALYDADKVCVKTLTNESMADTTIIAEIPSGVRYVRATGRSGVCPTFEYLTHITDKDVDSFVKSNGYTNLYGQATKRPVVSIIDDDTWSTQDITWMKNKCDELGIKISFACLTSRFAVDNTLKDTLLSFERQGFPVLLHGYTQGVFYKPEPDRDISAAEDDFVHGLQDMNKAGFSDYKACWVTPFGRYDGQLKQLAIKWGMESIVRYSPEEKIEDPTKLNPLHRYELFRYEYDDETFENKVKALIDKCVSCNGWFLFGVHSAQPANQTVAFKSSFERVVNYAKDQGCEIRTLNEELRRRMPIYNNYERY